MSSTRQKALRSIGMTIVLILSTVSILVAADYPAKSITLIAPHAPGGTLDIVSRSFANVAEKYLGKPVTVMNKPGASGTIGGAAGAQAAPDGYTITIGGANFTSAIEWEIANGRKPPFTRHDFVPLGALTMNPTILSVPYDSPWKTLADFIKDCKSKPDFYSFCSSGPYGSTHLAAMILMKAAGIRARHVPYSGGGPCTTALLGKHVQFAPQLPSNLIPLMRANKLRPLAVIANERMESIPEIRTAKEQGVDAEYYTWDGIMAPKLTPAPIVARLRDVVKQVARDKSFTEILGKSGVEVSYMSGENLEKHWDKESKELAALMADIVKETPQK